MLAARIRCFPAASRFTSCFSFGVRRLDAAFSFSFVPFMSEVIIRLRDDGPLVIQGPVKIIDAEGNAFVPPANKPLVALCRCGGSTNKPFCDGTHSKIGFQGAEKAVREAEGR